MLHMLYLIAAFMWSNQPDWTWSTHPDLGFKVLTPCLLEDHVSQVPTELEVITYHQLRGGSLSDSALAMSFIIDHYRLPGEQQYMNEAELNEFFDNTLNPILEAIDGELVYADIMTNGGKDICSWRAIYRNGECLIRGESMIIDGSYYGLQAFGWTKDKPEDAMNKFFASFRLLSAQPDAEKISPRVNTKK